MRTRFIYLFPARVWNLMGLTHFGSLQRANVIHCSVSAEIRYVTVWDVLLYMNFRIRLLSPSSRRMYFNSENGNRKLLRSVGNHYWTTRPHKEKMKYTYAYLKLCSYHRQKRIGYTRLVPFSCVLFPSSSKGAVWKHFHEKTYTVKQVTYVVRTVNLGSNDRLCVSTGVKKTRRTCPVCLGNRQLENPKEEGYLK
jgi:hypothetical protein